jgi:signal transduction histidine kinase
VSVALAEVNKVGRFRLLGWTFVLTAQGLVGLGLASLLVTVVTVMSVWVGVPLTLWAISWLHDFADWHRTRFARLVGIEIPRPYLPVPEHGWLGRLRAVGRDSANWRDSAWLLVNGTLGITLCMVSFCLFLGGLFYVLQPAIWPLAPRAFNGHYGLFTIHNQSTSFLAMPLGAAGLLLWWWSTPSLVRADAWLARRLLAPTERSKLAGRVRHLAASRADTVDAQAAELRRVEQDLHDGAQARLVGLGMSLGMAYEILETNPAEARRLLGVPPVLLSPSQMIVL